MKRLKILILILILALQLSAQIKIHKSYSTADGLVQNTINDIFLDSFGYMWFATDAGVSRWDGINFKNYTVNNGLASSIVLDIEQGVDSTIYLATFGKGVTTFKNGVFDTLTTEDGLISDFVSIIKKFDDEIYLVSGGNIQKIQVGNFLDIGKEFSIPTLDINDFIVSENKALVGSVSNGLFIYENSEVKHFTSKNGLNGDFVTKIIFDNDNNLIIGTDKGPNKLLDGKILKVNYKNINIQSPVHNLLLTQNGDIVYSTSDGVYIENNNEITNINIENGLPQKIVWSAVEDFDSNLYFGTSNSGFCLYQKYIFENYKYLNGIQLDGLTGLELSNNGSLILSSTKDLFFFDMPDKLNKISNFSKNPINSIYKSKDGQLFATTENGYLIYENGTKRYYAESSSNMPNTFYAVLEDYNNGKYLASNSGVIVLDNNNNSRITTSNGIVGNFVNSIYITSDSTLLIGTHGQGFSSIKNGKIKNYTRDSGLSDLTIQCFLELPDETVLIGTRSGGINIFKDERIISINNDNGLLSNDIIDLELDNLGNIYAATTNGINIIDYINGFSIRSITEKDGLVSNECITDGIEVDTLNNIIIATKGGLSIYKPEMDKQVLTPPKTYIYGFEIYNKAQDLRKFKTQPFLNYDQNYLNFSYVGINISAPHKTNYKYKLSGVDKDWVESKGTSVQYTSLDDGNYTFEVKARNEWGYLE